MAQGHAVTTAEPEHSPGGLHREKCCQGWNMQPLGCCWAFQRSLNEQPGATLPRGEAAHIVTDLTSGSSTVFHIIENPPCRFRGLKDTLC